MERTLVLIKPDGVKRRLIGAILQRFEQRDLHIAGLKLMNVSHQLAEKHYSEHHGKPFFENLISFITSGPLVAFVIEGHNSISIVRQMIGPTNPKDAPPGTIRGDFALLLDQNVIHGSDSKESATREISLFFKSDELI